MVDGVKPQVKIEDITYMPIKYRLMRTAYNTPRTTMKISLTLNTQQIMEEIGAIKLEKNKRDEIVAKRGGYGSPFFEFCVWLFSSLIKTNLTDEEVEEVAAVLRTIVRDHRDAVDLKKNIRRVSDAM